METDYIQIVTNGKLPLSQPLSNQESKKSGVMSIENEHGAADYQSSGPKQVKFETENNDTYSLHTFRVQESTEQIKI